MASSTWIAVDNTLVYHEPQSSALCGRHALNNLLQGPYLDEFYLAEIARELDEKERELMLAEGVDTPDALRYMAEDSANVDDSGNFSISVLREALFRGHGVTINTEPAIVTTALDNPSAFEAYLLNLQSHWFVIRRLETAAGPRWFNLNSLLKLPEMIGDFYLSAYLAELKAEGYFIFAVEGTPLPRPMSDRSVGSPDCWHTVSEIQAGVGKGAAGGVKRQAAERAKQAAREDPEYAAALKASMAG